MTEKKSRKQSHRFSALKVLVQASYCFSQFAYLFLKRNPKISTVRWNLGLNILIILSADSLLNCSFILNFSSLDDASSYPKIITKMPLSILKVFLWLICEVYCNVVMWSFCGLPLFPLCWRYSQVMTYNYSFSLSLSIQ